MKKSLVALAALAVAGVASAQSSVTLFGIVDAGISYYQTTSRYQNTALNVFNPNAAFPLAGFPDVKQSQWALSTAGLQTSRFGLRGTEDLGGGLAASFWLEAGINNDTGAAGDSRIGSFFNRRATVSLSGNFGEVRLGRDYTPTYWNDNDFDPFGTNGVGASAIYTQALAATNSPDYVRKSNSIGYLLPSNLGGFYGQLQYGFHENLNYDPATMTPADGGTYKSRTGRSLGGRLGYASGPLNVAVAYNRNTVDDNYYAGNTTNLDTGNVGASWDFGAVKLFGEYSRLRLKTEYEFTPIVGIVPDATTNGYLLGATMPVGAGLIRASYSHIKVNLKNQAVAAFNLNAPDPKADKFALGYVHNLSKRTALYATFAYTKNKNGAQISNGGSPTYINPTLLNLANSGAGYRADKAYGYDFGIRHAF